MIKLVDYKLDNDKKEAVFVNNRNHLLINQKTERQKIQIVWVGEPLNWQLIQVIHL